MALTRGIRDPLVTLFSVYYVPNFEKVGGILLLACLFIHLFVCSLVRSLHFLVHSITLEPCMLMF